MVTDSALAKIAAAQLVAGIAGLIVALRRRRAYEFLWLSGSPDRVGRDAVGIGTALSAPAPMLVAQAVSTAVLARGPSVNARRGLGLLGAAMVGGYLGERLVRERLSPNGWDVVESTIAVAGLSLAAAMAASGLRASPARERLR